MKPVHTHYDNLKVARNAPPEVIRAAYKTLCHKFHPDRHGGSAKATQTFQLINTAYEVLSDPERRRRHDAWIARAEQGQESAAAAPRAWNGRERRKKASVNAAAGTGSAAAQSTRQHASRDSGHSGSGQRDGRRNGTGSASHSPSRMAAGLAAIGLRMPGIVTVLWASVAMVGALLVLMYQG